MFTTFFVSILTSFITGLITFSIQERKLKLELRTEYMAEEAVRKLLEVDKWKKRSFNEIKKKIGGFQDDELKKILIRAGAVRFEGKEKENENEEYWGLIRRNLNELNIDNN